MSSPTKKVMHALFLQTGYKISSVELNQEIIHRLAYTLIDPFYDKQ